MIDIVLFAALALVVIIACYLIGNQDGIDKGKKVGEDNQEAMVSWIASLITKKKAKWAITDDGITYLIVEKHDMIPSAGVIKKVKERLK